MVVLNDYAYPVLNMREIRSLYDAFADYPVKPEWRKVFWRDCDVLNLSTSFGREHVSITYFEALMDLETKQVKEQE